MAAGLPVAAPATALLSGMVSDENGGLLPAPGDEEGLTDLLRTLAADKTLRERLGEANRAKAVVTFDAAKILATFRRLFASAMKREF